MPFLRFTFVCLVSALVAGAAWKLCFRLVPEAKQAQSFAWLRPWAFKGLAVPALAWLVMNIGLSWSFPAFMPQIQAAQNLGQNWVEVFLGYAANGVFVISTFWAGATLVWAVAETARPMTDESAKAYRSLCGASILGMLVVALILLAAAGWYAAGLAVFLMLAPIAGYAPSVVYPRKMPPMYARAIAKMKFGKYSEAEMEVIRQLESYEDDFEGWMMLATLYAEKFDDLPQAEQTILEICDQPATNASQVSQAFHRLADWHLKLRADPEAARRALGIICDRFPGSHLAKMARARMNQIPATTEALIEQQSPKAIPLPALGDSLDVESQPVRSLAREKAIAVANDCTIRLTRDPNEVAPREQLARLLTEQLGKTEAGLEQLNLLLSMPDQPDEKRAEWLSLAAAWNLKYLRNKESGKACLEKLIGEFPGSVQALAARRRLELLRREEFTIKPVA